MKFAVNELPPIEDYLRLLLKELELNCENTPKRLKTLYFGGGTPSLLNENQFQSLFEHLHKQFDFNEKIEITLEINPGTVEKNKFFFLKDLGVNRYSLGVQTFQAQHLKACGRLHSPEDSLKDLDFFSDQNTNYSLDLLFGLPNQSLKEVQEDLKNLQKFRPPHVSAYNLTLPQNHSFNKGRASDRIQVEMMRTIQNSLAECGIHRYEISNFAQKNCESRHNQIYWHDQSYLGLGMGAHSYFKDQGVWGKRTWNTGQYKKYALCVDKDQRPHQSFENLKKHEALTDFCHTSLRLLKGLSIDRLQNKFALTQKQLKDLKKRLNLLEQKELITSSTGHWALTSTGLEMPNEVFKEVCFLEEDLTSV